jgi:hypothetical protein
MMRPNACNARVQASLSSARMPGLNTQGSHAEAFLDRPGFDRPPENENALQATAIYCDLQDVTPVRMMHGSRRVCVLYIRERSLEVLLRAQWWQVGMGALGGHRLGVSQRQAQGDAIPTPLHALRLPPNPHAPSSSPASSVGDAELTLPSLAGTREARRAVVTATKASRLHSSLGMHSSLALFAGGVEGARGAARGPGQGAEGCRPQATPLSFVRPERQGDT